MTKLDWLLKPRLSILVQSPSSYFIACICPLLAIAIYPLFLIPFAGAVPAAAVLLFGVGLITKDGFAMLIGLLLTIVAVFLTWQAFGAVN